MCWNRTHLALLLPCDPISIFCHHKEVLLSTTSCFRHFLLLDLPWESSHYFTFLPSSLPADLSPQRKGSPTALTGQAENVGIDGTHLQAVLESGKPGTFATSNSYVQLL